VGQNGPVVRTGVDFIRFVLIYRNLGGSCVGRCKRGLGKDRCTQTNEPMTPERAQTAREASHLPNRQDRNSSRTRARHDTAVRARN
jgi:hypothetical protein